MTRDCPDRFIGLLQKTPSPCPSPARGEGTPLQRARPAPSPLPNPLADLATSGGKLAKASLLGEGQGEGGLAKRTTGFGMRRFALLLGLTVLFPVPSHAWLLWTEMVNQISIKPQAAPIPFPKRSVPVPGTATLYVPDRDAAEKLSNPVPATAASVAKGKQLYSIYCTPCHGTSGTGNGLVGEKLSARPFDLTSDVVQTLPDGVIFGFLTFGGQVMPKFANDLSPVERWHVLNYLRHGLKPAVSAQAASPDK